MHLVYNVHLSEVKSGLHFVPIFDVVAMLTPCSIIINYN
jgi:hypothetical protein